MGEAGVTKQLADFVVNTRYEDLPPEAIKSAKTMILDTLGCGIAGYFFSKKDVAPVFEIIEEVGGNENCTLLVNGKKTSWFNAILGNGTLMHSIDYDDTRSTALTHVGVVVVPAALTVQNNLPF